MYENEFIIGRSSLDKEYYDVLAFCVRDIQVAEIPNFIEVIAPYSFQNCTNLQKVIKLQHVTKLLQEKVTFLCNYLIASLKKRKKKKFVNLVFNHIKKKKKKKMKLKI